MIDWKFVMALCAAAVAGIVWLVRLEGRINLGEAAHTRIQADITEIKGDIKLLLTHSHIE